MDVVFQDFRSAVAAEDGYKLATTITPIAPSHDAGRLYNFWRSANYVTVQEEVASRIAGRTQGHLTPEEVKAWVEIFVVYWKAIGALLAAEEATNQGKPSYQQWAAVYNTWKEMVNALIKGYSGSNAFEAWTVPCLYVAGKYLRNFAIKADDSAAKSKGNVDFTGGYGDDIAGSLERNEKLEDAARQINRIFSLCISDRAPLEESRKWGLYYTTNLLFKIYFKLNSIGLSKNIIRSIQATRTDMPALESFPKAHIVTFKYYVGVIFFLEEDYVKAEENLTEAWRLCHKDAHKNKELILTYLIPCHLLTTHTLPTINLLRPYPRLQRLFLPLSACIKRGDLAGFDAALIAGEEEFVKRRIYLTLERGRDITLRNLLRKVFLAGGYEPLKEGETEDKRVRRTRVPVADFTAAIGVAMKQQAGEILETDEVECLLANMIYKNLMKGYIARDRGIVVLSKAGAFPGTGV